MKMKSYLCAFLLFLLLVDKSLSARIPPSLTKVIYKEIRGQAFDYIWEQTLDSIKQKFSPSEPNEPRKRIEGLSSIKEYLSNYGYLQSSVSTFDDYLDEQTTSAITNYQKHFKLQVTGDLNDETFQQISLPRCGVPDMNFDYDLTENVSYPKAGHRWFPEGKNLTYGFLPVSEIPDNATKVFRDSFTRWAQATGVLSLTETTYDNADIKVGFYNFTYLGIDDEVSGGSLIFLQPDSSKTGEVLLDGTKFWALPSENDSLSWQDGVFDLESVAMHQIGHLLGLDHSNMKESVMYPYVLPSQQRKVELSDSDKDKIQQQYSNGNSGHGGSRGMLLITALSLGFAYVILLY